MFASRLIPKRHSRRVQRQLRDDLESRLQRDQSEHGAGPLCARVKCETHTWIPDLRSALPHLSGMTVKFTEPCQVTGLSE